MTRDPAVSTRPPAVLDLMNEIAWMEKHGGGPAPGNTNAAIAGYIRTLEADLARLRVDPTPLGNTRGAQPPKAGDIALMSRKELQDRLEEALRLVDLLRADAEQFAGVASGTHVIAESDTVKFPLYACHVEIEQTADGNPDDCVLNEGMPENCIYARDIARPCQCKYWLPAPPVVTAGVEVVDHG